MGEGRGEGLKKRSKSTRTAALPKPVLLARSPRPLIEPPLNRIVAGDCIAGMNALPAGSVDLVFADPPFNIGYD